MADDQLLLGGGGDDILSTQEESEKFPLSSFKVMFHILAIIYSHVHKYLLGGQKLKIWTES